MLKDIKMRKGDKIKCYCEWCHGKTNHEIMAVELTRGAPDDYQYENYDCIIKCCGCDYTSFYNKFIDIETGIYDLNGEWINTESEKQYPEINENIVKIQDFNLVPPVVSQIYNETISAIKSKSFIIAGAGMRAIIEAICNDKNITGKDLKSRISKIVSIGIISKNDGKKLHGIRFLGNDSVHNIKPATSEELYMALRIVIHLLETVYTLSHASSILDTTIESYGEFKELIDISIMSTSIKNGSIISLRGLLGRKCRRIENIDTFELQFSKEISQGIISKVSLEPNKDPNGKNLYKIIK
jgi:hypothetical protein